MPERADAHAHLFKPGYVGGLGESCRLIAPDEITLYEALANRFKVKQLLAIGFEGDDLYRGNNDYLAEVAASHPWVRPAAYFHDPRHIDLAALERRRQQKFVGISLYLFKDESVAALAQVPDAIWQWLVNRRWLVSVNSTGKHWSAWQAVLNRFPQLHLLISHLGLPGAIANPADASARLATVLALAQHPQVHVKLSGFYALTDPQHDYPHRAAWPMVEQLLKAFGATRLLWGSDFSPALEFITFPQTLDLFAQMPFLNATDRARIEGNNLMQLLAEVAG